MLITIGCNLHYSSFGDTAETIPTASAVIPSVNKIDFPSLDFFAVGATGCGKELTCLTLPIFISGISSFFIGLKFL